MNQRVMQAFVDSMSREWQERRAGEQMTLGALITELEGLSPGRQIGGFGRLRSYRGYYRDLAFEPIEASQPVGSLLEVCRSAMGHVFEGYKGGDYLMGERTPLWLSDYGEASGLRLMGLDIEHELVRPVVEPEDWSTA